MVSLELLKSNKLIVALSLLGRTQHLKAEGLEHSCVSSSETKQAKTQSKCTTEPFSVHLHLLDNGSTAGSCQHHTPHCLITTDQKYFVKYH